MGPGCHFTHDPILFPVVAQIMLVSALFGLIEKARGADFDPMQTLTGIEIRQE